MGTATIEEYANLADVNGSEAQIPGTPLAVQTVTTSGTTARTGADFNASTRYIIISSDADELFEVGDGTVTAAAGDRPLYAKSYREVEIKSADTRIAFINK